MHDYIHTHTHKGLVEKCRDSEDEKTKNGIQTSCTQLFPCIARTPLAMPVASSDRMPQRMFTLPLLLLNPESLSSIPGPGSCLWNLELATLDAGKPP